MKNRNINIDIIKGIGIILMVGGALRNAFHAFYLSVSHGYFLYGIWILL